MTTTLWLADVRLLSGNVHLRSHWAAYKRTKDEIAWHLRAALMGTQKALAATGKRKVTITRQYGRLGKAFDEDNLYTAVKPLVDCLVKEGLLIDDKPSQLELHVKQQKALLVGVEITIEEAD